jgi:antitoxin (DNA-binding transcriptional repressor) of toxin-antitoxin stability system
VNIHQAKSSLSALLVEVEEKGEVILICRNGKPVAELRGVRRAGGSRNLEPHPLYSKFETPADIMEPGGEGLWEAFE